MVALPVILFLDFNFVIILKETLRERILSVCLSAFYTTHSKRNIVFLLLSSSTVRFTVDSQPFLPPPLAPHSEYSLLQLQRPTAAKYFTINRCEASVTFVRF